MARKKKITKTQVIEATHKLIQTQGVNNITTRKIAKTGGFSTQPIYYDFTSVDELVSFTINSIVNDFKKTIEKIKSSTFSIIDLDTAFLNYIDKEIALAKILISDTPFAKQAYELLTDASYELLNIEHINNSDLRKKLEHNWHVMTAISSLEINQEIEVDRKIILDLVRNQIDLVSTKQ